jgi:hypothetical protein
VKDSERKTISESEVNERETFTHWCKLLIQSDIFLMPNKVSIQIFCRTNYMFEIFVCFLDDHFSC